MVYAHLFTLNLAFPVRDVFADCGLDNAPGVARV
jgi:hypothetical protein